LVQLVGLEALEARVPAAMVRARALASELARALASDHGGTIGRSSVRGMAIAFDEASEACSFAVHIQEQLLSLDWPPTVLVHPDAAEVRDDEGRLLYRGLRARTAIHKGPFRATETGGIKGPAVYQAARLLHAAHPGQTLISSEAWRYLRGPLPPGAVLRDLGRHSLPGVQGASRVFQLMAGPLDARSFPAGLATDVARQRRPRILGRESDLEALRELLALGIRWVSITGPTGVGRSRLVAQLAANAPERFRRGAIHTVSPRSGDTLELVRAVADTMAVPLSRALDIDRAIEQLGHAFLARGEVLLAIDGHETDATAVQRWLDLAPGLRVVEHRSVAPPSERCTRYLLRALEAGAGPQARHSDAVRLYTLAATQAKPDFQLAEPLDAALVVKALGGNALAIRIAAGAVHAHPPSKLAAHCLGREVPLQEVLELSVASLDDDERRVLCAAAVVPGWFEPDLVGGLLDPPVPPEGVVELLRSLTSRSLLVRRVDQDLAQITRYSVPPPVAEHVTAQLEPEELEHSRKLVADQVLERGRYWTNRTFDRSRPEVLARLSLDWDKLLAIVDWGLKRAPDDARWADRAMAAVLILEPVLRSRGPLPLELQLLDASIAAADSVLGNDPSMQVKALVSRADCRLRAGVDGWQSDLDRARSVAERWGDDVGLARGELIQGRAYMVQGDDERAIAAFMEVHERFLALDDPMRAAFALALAGAVHLRHGRFDDAEQALVAGSMSLRTLQARHLLARVLGWLAELYRRTGRVTAARSVSREAIRLHEELGSVIAECTTRQELATLDYQLTRYGEASAGLGLAIERARAVGDRRQESRSLRLLAVVSLARADRASARKHLLEALALSRARRDGHAEGEVMGYLGLLYHLDEQPDAARTYFAQARAQLRAERAYPLLALFTAWAGELEAEQLDLESAMELYEAAAEVLRATRDGATEQAVQLLAQVRVLAAGVLGGDAEGGRQELRRRLKGTDPRELSAEGRLAYRRVRRLATRGLLQRTPPPAPRTRAPDRG
jgi:tetratricopeptide (TPR) repeat protein